MDERYVFPARVTQDEGGFFLIQFRDLPEAHTDAKTLDEALIEAADCLEEAIAVRIIRGDEIPVPSRAKRGDHAVPVPAVMAAKAALVAALKDSGMSKIELARRLGIDQKDARRLCDPKHPTKIGAIAGALRVFGKSLVVGVRDAA